MPQTARGARKTSRASARKGGSSSGTAGNSSRARKPARKKAASARPAKNATRKPAAPAARRTATPKRKTTGARRAGAGRKPAARRPAAGATPSGPRGNGAGVREALLARRAETLALLERSADYGKQRLREDAEDLVDQASDSQAREVVYALSSAEGDMIKRIDGALQRLDAGEYGICVSCGEPIQRRRLEAVPWATLCVACQELQEQGILQAD